MRWAMRGVALLWLIAALCSAVGANVLITELLYQPRMHEEWFEFVELYNTGPGDVALGGWSFEGINFTFPSVSIAAEAYLVVVPHKVNFLKAYSYLTTEDVVGDFSSSLSNSGEKITLLNAQGATVAEVDYEDGDPWPVLANGFGASVELMCYEPLRQNDPLAWTSSPVPANPDSHIEFGGTPGRPNSWLACLGSPRLPVRKIHFTEIMYHPVKKNNFEEMHEFVELYNEEEVDIDVSYWRIVAEGGFRYTFPAGTILAANKTFLVAKSPADFRAVYGRSSDNKNSALSELKNGNDKLALVDNNNNVVDYVDYEDSGEWPKAADSFGAGQNDLPDGSRFKINYESYRFKGQSLTRRTLAWGADKAYAWRSDDPSPGTWAPETKAQLLPIISHSISPKKTRIYKNSTVIITAELKPWPIEGLAVHRATIEYYKEDAITLAAPSPVTRTMQVDATKPDIYSFSMPLQEANTIIRYKLKVEFVDNGAITSPLIDDPFTHHAYFVDPEIETKNKVVHMFLNPDRWGTLIANAQGGRMDDCTTNPNWQGTIRGVVVYDGEVIDADIRYQGSRFNRVNGIAIDDLWAGVAAGVGPTSGGLKAWSYKLNVPAYAKLNGRKKIILHKMLQGCAFYSNPIMHHLHDAAGTGTTESSFVRFHVNGYYLRYMLMLSHNDDPDRKIAVNNDRCWELPSEKEGDYFKMQGLNGDEGPYGRGDMSQMSINPTCPAYSIMNRYEWTYGRHSHEDWGTHDDLKELVDAIAAAKDKDKATVKAMVDKYVDVNLLLNYIAIFSWAGTWDQVFHNQYAYRRREDGKWTLHPWDGDFLFGEHAWQEKFTLYAGRDEEDTSKHQKLRYNVIDAYRSELNERYRLMMKTILSEEYFIQTFNNVLNQLDLTAILTAPGGWAQNWTACNEVYIGYAAKRNAHVKSQVGVLSPDVDAWSQWAEVSCPSRPKANRVYNTFRSIPGKVGLVKVANLSSSQVTLEWTNPRDGGFPLTFEVFKGSNTTHYEAFASAKRSVLASISDYNVTAGERVYYFVQAANQLGAGEMSEPLLVVVPTDCAWNSWTAWSACTDECGGGERTRSRSMVLETAGGVACEGLSTETGACNEQPCPPSPASSDRIADGNGESGSLGVGGVVGIVIGLLVLLILLAGLLFYFLYWRPHHTYSLTGVPYELYDYGDDAARY